MRLFIGIPVPPAPSFAAVTRVLLGAAPDGKAVPEGSWHITLRFLGEVPDPAPVAAALDRALLGQHALHGLVEGLGAFPSARKAGVVWAAVQAVGLDEVAQKVRAATATMGARETKPFHAHVTLLRLPSPKDLHAFLEQHQGTGFAEGWLDRVVLWRSELGPKGPRYTPMHTVALPLPGDDGRWPAALAPRSPAHPAGASPHGTSPQP